VRAPGHAFALAEKDGDEIVLEPDAMLTLDANGLRACLVSVGPYDDYTEEHENDAMFRIEYRRAIAWRWISDDRWAICVSTELVDEAMGSHKEIHLVVHWRDSRSAMLKVRLARGARESWTVPCEPLVRALPLDVSIVAPADVRAGALAVHLGAVPAHDEHSRVESFSWGSIVSPFMSRFWVDRTVPLGSTTIHFETAPAGVQLCLAARDKTTSSYGRIVFVHNGSSRTLELRPAFELVGRVVSGIDSSPLKTADMGWEFVDGDKTIWGWQAWNRHFALERDGSFRLRGPQAPLAADDTPLDPPGTCSVVINAPGFEHFERRFDTAGARRFDCGELRLKPLAPQVVLAAGHGLTPKSIEWSSMHTWSDSALIWLLRNGALESDGSMDVYVLEDDASVPEHRAFIAAAPTDGAWVATPWPTEPPRWLTLYMIGDDVEGDRLFERQSDGRYAAVPRREMDLVLECGVAPPDGKGWWLGWKRGELWGTLGVPSPNVVGNVVRVHVSVPEDASLYWSIDSFPPTASGTNGGIGGSIAFDAITGKIVLR
jgi:hypothetical protein